MATRDTPWAAILLGAAAGAGVSLIVWKVIDSAIDSQLEAGGRRMLEQGGAALESQMLAQLDREVPPRVRSELQATLASYNITPETGARLDRVLAAADRIGII